MALTNKQKDIKDKKVEELTTKISDKQAQLARHDTTSQELHDKIQSEIDELLLAKKAFEDLK